MLERTKGKQSYSNELIDGTDAKRDKSLIVIGMFVFAVASLWLIPQVIYFDTYVKIGGEIYDVRAIYYRVAAVIVFTLFIPFTSVSYYYSRRRVRKRELLEDFNMLKLDYRYYVGIYSRDNKPMHFFYAAGFASVVSVLGLLAVLLGDELGLDVGSNLLLGGAFVESTVEITDPDMVTPTDQEVPDAVVPGAVVPDEAVPDAAVPDAAVPAASLPDASSPDAAVPDEAAAQGVVNLTEESSQVQRNSLMFFGIAFLGAYLWGLQQIIIRYFRNDLAPGVYYNLGVRMIFAAIIALLTYQMIHAVGLDPSGDEAGIGIGLLPATAFLIGIFPQRAIRYMTERINIFSSTAEPSVNAIPLETIQGISVDDKLRLVEEGVDSVNDLANADVVRLLFTTPYTTSQLVDWMLQAKLCVLVGVDIKELQAQSVRSARDLKMYTEGGKRSLDKLSEETKITKSTIEAAHRSVSNDKAVAMLIELYERVNTFKNLRLAPEGGQDEASLEFSENVAEEAAEEPAPAVAIAAESEVEKAGEDEVTTAAGTAEDDKSEAKARQGDEAADEKDGKPRKAEAAEMQEKEGQKTGKSKAAKDKDKSETKELEDALRKEFT